MKILLAAFILPFSITQFVQANDADMTISPNGPVVTAKILRYAERLIRRYDTNSDGCLQETEWRVIGGSPSSVDFDGDTVLTLREFSRHVADYAHRRKIRLIPKNFDIKSPSPTLLQPVTSAAPDTIESQTSAGEKSHSSSATKSVTQPPASGADFRAGQRFYVDPRHRMQGLPAWFVARDANGDQQVSLAEYAPSATESDIKEFSTLDANGDGLITAEECVRKTSASLTPPSKSN